MTGMVTRAIWKGMAALVAVGAMSPSMAQTVPPPAVAPQPPRYTMPSTHMFDVTSDGGETYRIFVSYPDGEPPEDGFPVLYVLDGNAMFASFAETRRMMEYGGTKKMIVVGVGYPTDKAYDTRRLNDYTPPLLDPPPAAWRRLAKYKSGGQDVFLAFLTGKLRTELAKRYVINTERQSLFGHSLGGIFALHALYTRPGAFYSIVAASPSLGWNNQGALTEERAFAGRVAGGRVAKTSRLLVVVGDRDVDDEPESAAALVKRMEPLSAFGLRTYLRRYPDEGHMTVPARAVPDTLRFVAGGY